MKQRLISTLVCAAALAAAPAMAQRSVSGTIGGSHAATATAAAASVPAPAAALPAAVPLDTPAALPSPGAAATAAASAPATEAPVAAPPATQPSALSMTIPTAPQAAPATGGGLLQTSVALLFVIGLMLGLAWLTKRYGPKNLGGGNRNVKLVGALSVGARERILVVEVGDQWIVVGASPGRMNALASMPRQESSEPASAVSVPAATFAEWFKQTIDKRNGK